MAQSTATSVDLWIDERPPERRAVFDHLRALCRAELPGWHERMEWGMPGYGPAGQVNAVSFNDQKRHIALYVGATVVERFRDRLDGMDFGKGCVRYRREAQIDFNLMCEMLRDIHARGGPA